jgi:hypothetical protein
MVNRLLAMVPTTHDGKETVSSIKDVGKTGYPLMESRNWTLISHYMQKQLKTD